jgi:hypothetical protein
MTVGRSGRTAAIGCVAALALCGCSSSAPAGRHSASTGVRGSTSAGSRSPATGVPSSAPSALPDRPVGALADALRTAADLPGPRRALQFSRPSAAARATKGAVGKSPYTLALEWAATELMTSPPSTQRALGIDPLSAAYQMSVGVPDDAAGVLGGLDLHALGRHLESDGATAGVAGTSTTYRLPVDKLGQNDKLAAALGAAFDLTVVRTRGSVVRFAATTRLLATVDPGQRSLAADPDFAATAACLGDPLAADFTDDLPALTAERSPAEGPAPATPGVRVVAVGLVGTAGVIPTEEMCVRTATPAQAAQLADGIRRALGSGRSGRNAKYWRDLLADPVVQVSGNTVRLSGQEPAGTSGGLLLTGLESAADLPGLGGES